MDVIAVLAVLVAATALVTARRVARKLEALNQSYWELRYDYTRLRSQVQRLDPEAPGAPGGNDAPPQAAPSPVTFVPLSSMKKKNE